VLFFPAPPVALPAPMETFSELIDSFIVELELPVALSVSTSSQAHSQKQRFYDSQYFFSIPDSSSEEALGLDGTTGTVALGLVTFGLAGTAGVEAFPDPGLACRFLLRTFPLKKFWSAIMSSAKAQKISTLYDVLIVW
jgi:hypothetical protein